MDTCREHDVEHLPDFFGAALLTVVLCYPWTLALEQLTLRLALPHDESLLKALRAANKHVAAKKPLRAQKCLTVVLLLGACCAVMGAVLGW